MSKYMKLAAAAAVAVGLSFGGAVAPANAVTFELDYEYTNGANPAGPIPWITATFTQMALNTVGLHLTGNLVDEEIMTTFRFNTGVTLDSATNTGGAKAVWNQPSNPATSAGGFDQDLDFAPPDNLFKDFFGAGSTSTWTLFGDGLTTALIAASLSDGDPARHVAAHIQRINGDSGWITTGPPSVVPLPAGLVLFLTGLAGIGFLGRYQAKRREPEII